VAHDECRSVAAQAVIAAESINVVRRLFGLTVLKRYEFNAALSSMQEQKEIQSASDEIMALAQEIQKRSLLETRSPAHER